MTSVLSPRKCVSTVVGAISFFSIFILSSSSFGQSFNCRYARTPDEVMICQDSDLANLDEEMANIYFPLRKRLGGRDLRRLENARNYWLSERVSCGRDAACIEKTYKAWIADLERLD
jgi:uncharacterized protein